MRSLATVLVPVPSIQEQESIIDIMRRKDYELARYRELAEDAEREAQSYIEDQIQRM